MAHLLSSAGPFGEESEPSAGQWLRSFNNRNVLPLQSYLKVVGAPILMSWSSHFLFLYFSCFLNLFKRFRKPNLDFGVANFNCQSAPQHCLLIVNPLPPPPNTHRRFVHYNNNIRFLRLFTHHKVSPWHKLVKQDPGQKVYFISYVSVQNRTATESVCIEKIHWWSHITRLTSFSQNLCQFGFVFKNLILFFCKFIILLFFLFLPCLLHYRWGCI